MKIAVVSDLHLEVFPDKKLACFDYFLDQADCLILGGDNATYDENYEATKKFFDLLRNKTNIPIGFVTGNHDLFGRWLPSDVSFSELKPELESYSSIARNFGIIHLEEDNLCLEDVAIGGTYGHYDGSLVGKINSIDAQTVQKLVEDTINRLRAYPNILLITHTIPTKKLIGRPDSPEQNQASRWAGSTKLENMIYTLQPKFHFCGHSHAYATQDIGDTHSINTGNDYDKFTFVMLNTEKDSTRIITYNFEYF